MELTDLYTIVYTTIKDDDILSKVEVVYKKFGTNLD